MEIKFKIKPKEPIFWLTDEWYIRKIDKLNWAVCERGTMNPDDGDPYYHEYKKSFHDTLGGAYKMAVKKAVLSADSNRDLVEIIERIESLIQNGWKKLQEKQA